MIRLRIKVIKIQILRKSKKGSLNLESRTKTKLTNRMVEKLVKTHFGEKVSIDEIVEATEGWFNAVYLVTFHIDGDRYEIALKIGIQNGKYTLRYEQDIMKTELDIYDLIESTIIPAPKILFRDFSYQMIDAPYFIMEKLNGGSWESLSQEVGEENQASLMEEMGRYLGALHNIKGDWFGYPKEDISYHYPDWRSAFQGMMNRVIEDGKKEGVDLPYDEVLSVMEPYWEIFEEIKVPCLVNFDMWTKNIMLREEKNRFVIDGIIDYERSFYGDCYADFLAVAENGGCPVEENEDFIKGYNQTAETPFSYTYYDQLRSYFYEIYLALVMGTEIYRYNEEDTREMLTYCRHELKKYIELVS